MAERQRRRDRNNRLGWAAILLPLGLGFVFALVLAYQAFDAGRRHRATARAAVREHAEFAAYLLASEVERRMRESLLYAFYPVDLVLRNPAAEPDPGTLPPPSALRVPPEAARCDPVMPATGRTFFRYGPTPGEVVAVGPRAPEIESWAATELPTWAAAAPELPEFRHVPALIDGTRRPVAWRRWEVDRGVVIYGFESCWRVRGKGLFEAVMAEVQAFPPSLVGRTPNDSLFTLAARYPEGWLIHGDTWARPGAGFYGTASLPGNDPFASAEVRVTLLPDVAERLVRGGLPESRLPGALGLVALTALLMAMAVWSLRREQRLVDLRSRFVRNVSHELRTPLQQVLLFTELLRSDRLRDADEKRAALDIIHVETRRLIELVHNVLRFSGPGEEELHPTDVDVSELTRETIAAFRPLAANRNVTIELEVDDRPRVAVDPDALKRILLNLLDNAVKYGPQGQTIRVTVGREAQHGRLAVEDQGPGVPPADRERIWDAFTRLERDEGGPTAGSGIGLSIVKRLVEALEGTVEVEQADSGGARFVCRFPLCRDGTSAERRVRDERAAS